MRASDQHFTVAAGIRSGLSEKQLRGGRWNRTVHGVRSTALAPTFEERCRMFATRMPDHAFFSHSTAARLLGIPLPAQREGADLLHISVAAPHRAPHARGISGHALRILPAQIREFHGFRTTIATRTWCELGTQLGLHDLVAAGDYLIHHRSPLTELPDLTSAVDSLVARRGVLLLREALPLLNDRAESPPESILRVILERGGLPAPRINRNITGAASSFIGRVDFAFDGLRLVLEYQGDYHRTSKDQWPRDMTRRSRLEAQGWRVMELNWDDLTDPSELVARIRALIARP